MRIALLGMFALTAVSPLQAQTPTNFPDGLNVAVDRLEGFSIFLRAAVANGEIMMTFSADNFEGIGDESIGGQQGNPACRLNFFGAQFADFDIRTSHTFGIRIRSSTLTGTPATRQPNMAAAGIVGTIGNIPSLTLANPGTNTARLFTQYVQQQSGGSPVRQQIPCLKTQNRRNQSPKQPRPALYFGYVLQPAAANSTDQLHALISYHDPSQISATTQGDAINFNQQKNVPNMVWFADPTSSGFNLFQRAFQTGTFAGESMAISLQGIGPSLMTGADLASGVSRAQDAAGATIPFSFGAQGLYPFIQTTSSGRRDGLRFRVSDFRLTGTGGAYIILTSLSRRSEVGDIGLNPTEIGGFQGSLYLGSPFFIGAQAPLLQATIGSIPRNQVDTSVRALANSYPASVASLLVGQQVHFQAVTARTDGSEAFFSNLVTVTTP